MTLLAERPNISSVTPDTASRAGSYVTLPAGSSVSASTEGSYVTVPGRRGSYPGTRGSYVAVSGAQAVDATAIEGSYVTLPAAE